MALRITCPGCKTPMKLDDEMRGQKVRCSNCNKSLNIPASNGKKQHADEEETIQEGRKIKTASERTRENQSKDVDDEEDRPKKKKKKKSKGMPVGLLVGVGIAVFVLLIGGGAGTAYYFMRTPASAPIAQNNKDKKGEDAGPKDGQAAQDNNPRPPERIIVPGIKEGNPDAKKGGTYIISGARGQAYRTERRHELKQIGLMFTDFCETHKGANRTLENFLKSIEREKLHAVIKEGYYVMNMKAATNTSESIIAYERDIDQGQKHLCVKGDCSVDYVPVQQLKELVK